MINRYCSIKFIAALFLVSLMFSSKPTYANIIEYKTISPQEVKSELNNPSSKMLLLDIRTPEEYKEGHIGKSINLPVEILDEEFPILKVKKDSFIVLYCQSGIRTRKGVEILEKLGYSNVYSLGGIKDWPYSIEK